MTQYDLIILLAVVGVGLAMLAAIFDVAVGRVPNSLNGALLVGALLFQASSTSDSLAGTWAVAAGALIVAALVWQRGWLGGGDVKMMVACVLWLPPASAALGAAVMAISGMVLGLSVAVRSGKLRGARVPYAPAVTIGFSWALIGVLGDNFDVGRGL